ncbi:cyclic nucleotide-binding domain-containing protein [Variovorax sp. J22R133]|uniref:cyclic nucleotide-binding domain-containing protein n=1 Tax=Variovorax brevis TaxID=3053503 RepID=UPI002576562E|nr:cyclic nucleotide-binding domain-containing protein [Variovorax sp. J22R133]MDM0111458.1 cyclic nucleotide-binding domain-containing protein [Variovorax sp. J22R133]
MGDLDLTTAVQPDAAAAQALLARCPIFRRCGVADLAALAASAHWVEHADGADLVREGDLSKELLILEHGHARVIKHGAHGDEHVLSRVGPGDSIGEMALFDVVPRSATVRAEGPVRCLALQLSDIVHLAESRPSLVPVLMDIGALVAERLRVSSANAAATADRVLAEERTRAVMGRFTLLLMLAYTLYTWVLGTAMKVKETFGHSEFVTVPAIFVCCAIMFAFVRVSGYPVRFFGLTTENAGHDVREAVLLTLPLMAGTVLLKLALLAWVPAMQGLPVFQMFSTPAPGLPASGFNPWLAAAYVVFAPFQELIYRGGVQGPLSHFLSGRWRTWLAIVGANIIFSAAHLYVSPGLAVIAFVAGLFWGWLYARQSGLVGVSVSHVLLGFWAFEVVDLGVLE